MMTLVKNEQSRRRKSIQKGNKKNKKGKYTGTDRKENVLIYELMKN